jgi:enolase-phosphatase E1
VSVKLRERGVRAVLLDIEGTTTPIAFVYDQLFPYARARLNAYLRSHASEDETRDVLRVLRDEWQEDARTKQEPPPWAFADMPAAACYLEWLMDRDRKSPSLKRVQGHIWQSGFQAGELRTELFPDVAPAFSRWKGSGLEVAIYSSGSVLAQKLIFGDLLPYISGFFDTSVGAKRSADSYRRIASELQLPSKQILFVSDVLEELNAALDAGFQSLLAVRPGNKPIDGSSSNEAIASFDEIQM